ncbi:MAG: hypothetical protein KA408_07510 [Flavobacteriales bacterium]|nr:hypothetical protein [Flavobacteriales bacterium]
MHNVLFPSNREAIERLVDTLCANKADINSEEARSEVMNGIKQLVEVMGNYDTTKLRKLFSRTEIPGPMDERTKAEIITRLKSRWQLPNEFFTVFDIYLGNDSYVDERISSILGIEASDFDSSSIKNIDPSTSLYHRADMYHLLRFALVAYLTVSFPFFDWEEHKDHYHARFRLNTRDSTNEAILEQEYLVVEKKCFCIGWNTFNGRNIAPYHYDIYAVRRDTELEFVLFNFVSDGPQSRAMNAMLYLLNAQLLDLPPKFILMLDERQHFDRYKTTASSMEKNIKTFGNGDCSIEEHKVADCFSKTIRGRLEQIFNQWDMRRNGDHVHVLCDADAIHYAKVLGLLPLPKMVRELYYSMVRSNGH